MKKFFFTRLGWVFVFVFTNQLLWAQATRTWVSGVGDDANPCSRTAPCKTFAGAVSKTALGGEINAIDPGGYGTIAITKSITIDGNGTMASILSSATNGITIYAPGAVVVLRNLSIDGAGATTGINGIRILSAKTVIIENCYISNFSQKGIEINTTDTCSVSLTNVTIHNTQDGVSVSARSGTLVIDHCNIQQIANVGISVANGPVVTSNSNLSGCAVAVETQSNSPILLSNNMVCNNGIAFQGTGKINSLGNNTVAGNTAQGVMPVVVKLQ